ncbi:MAG: XdhC family protein [Chloroflexi bacterium]|nr:XdhC family protein [Chloroflexota bacterium]
MRDILPQIDRWQKQGKAAAVATVIKVYGSAPRPLGAKMAVSSTGEIVGSVSGGCVESAVAQEALAVLSDHRARRLVFGIADEWAQSAGLACGGEIEIFVEPFAEDEALQRLRAALNEDRIATLATVVEGPGVGDKLLVEGGERVWGRLRPVELHQWAVKTAQECLRKQRSERRSLETRAWRGEIFFETYAPPPELIIVGAVHIAIALARFAKELGFRVIVIDARSAFATQERFPHADELLRAWPEDAFARLNIRETSYIAVLSHDDKLDIPALHIAVSSPARYVGALGARKTMAQRMARLQELGLSKAQLSRIHNPIGLDLGARSPEEIALAIMAEIVAVKNGKGRRFQ